MRSRRPSPEHQEAVSRRLALLSAELAGVRSEPEPSFEPDGVGWSDGPIPIRPGRAGARDPVVVPFPVPRPSMPEPTVPEPTVPAPPVPVPGRHASRRREAGRVALLPESLRGRIALGPAQLSVIAVLVALGLAVTCWWVVRGDASQVVAPTLASPAAELVSVPPAGQASPAPLAAAAAGSGTAASGSPASGSAASGSAASGTVTVDVAGKVRRPGIAVLGAGSRVVDAIRAAGGARPGVDLASLNLARPLVDGEQILVGVPAPTGLAASAVPSAGAPGTLVNLNTATEAELEALPDVGPVTAQAIITWRDQHGGFTAVDELLEVDGIGDATLGKLAPFVTV